MVGVNIKEKSSDQVASKKNNSGLEGTNHTLFQTEMIKIDTLLQTKTAKKLYPLAPHIPIPSPHPRHKCSRNIIFPSKNCFKYFQLNYLQL